MINECDIKQNGKIDFDEFLYLFRDNHSSEANEEMEKINQNLKKIQDQREEESDLK